MNITFRPAVTAEVLPLRHRILRDNDPTRAAGYPEDDLPGTRHFGAFRDQEILGCLTFLSSLWKGIPAFQLRGMAVSAQFQGQGLGRQLLEFSLRTIRQEVPKIVVWCNARISARPFYLKQGWEVASGEFDIPGVGRHCQMVLKPGSP